MPLRCAMPRRSGILGDMSDEASHGNERQSLAVGDRRRVAIGKAAFSTLWTAIAFFVFTVPSLHSAD